MPEQIELTWNDAIQAIRSGPLPAIVEDLNLKDFYRDRRLRTKARKSIRVFGIPNGGIPATLLLCNVANITTHNYTFIPTESPSTAHLFFDDIIDSGRTQRSWKGVRDIPFFAIVDKTLPQSDPRWVSFPWERMQRGNDGIEDNVRRILQFIGEDPEREGLKETPIRVAKAYSELFSGYGQNVADVLKVFEDGACDEMVILKDIEFTSFCEHHLLPFVGSAHIAYIPNGKVVGISKLARIMEIFSRRLQIQERLCQSITRALMDHLEPKGAACLIEAKHLCMSCRGVNKQHSKMVTSSLEGAFRDDPAARAEFFAAVRG